MTREAGKVFEALKGSALSVARSIPMKDTGKVIEKLVQMVKDSIFANARAEAKELLSPGHQGGALSRQSGEPMTGCRMAYPLVELTRTRFAKAMASYRDRTGKSSKYEKYENITKTSTKHYPQNTPKNTIRIACFLQAGCSEGCAYVDIYLFFLRALGELLWNLPLRRHAAEAGWVRKLLPQGSTLRD